MVFDIPTATPLTIEFQTKAINGTRLNIDREARTITDVLLIRAGEADGHGFNVEASFIEDMFKYIRKSMGGRVQCNMGHRYDANFFQLGRFNGFKLSEDGQECRASLTVYEAADKSPAMAGMADWFLDLAEEDAEAVMCSIKFEAGGYYQYDKKGTKVYLQSSWYSGPVKQFEDKPVFVEFKRLFSCDIVDQGALTDSLFSATGGPTSAARTFAEIVNAPGFIEWMREHEDHFPQLQAYYQDKFKWSLGRFFSGIFTQSKDMSTETQVTQPEAPEETPVALAPVAAEPATEQMAAPHPDIEALSSQVAQLQAETTRLLEELAARDARITELSAQPAAEPTTFATEPAGRVNATGKAYLANPINARARANAGV